MVQSQHPWRWPRDARAAVSLSFDDTRLSQADVGLPILDRHGVRATFYLSPYLAIQRRDVWRQALSRGHELGNHTMTHPCSRNFAWVRNSRNPLESYDLDRMDAELAEANAWIEREFGIVPQTYAYPCGEMIVGEGTAAKSYSPLVAKRFLAGRGYRNECCNAPAYCDLSRLMAFGSDATTFAHLRAMIRSAAESGGWVILASHEVSDSPRPQAIRTGVLDRLCAYLTSPESGVWVDTVATVAAYVAARRMEMQQEA